MGHFVFVVGGLLYATSLFASPVNLTSAKPFPLKLVNGKPDFSVTYVYDREFEWKLTYGSQITGAKSENLFWSFYDTKDKKSISEWKSLSFAELASGPLTTKESELVKRVLVNQPRTEILIAEKKDGGFRAKYWVALGELCSKYPGQFRNLSQLGKGCAEISARDIPSEGACGKNEKGARVLSTRCTF